VQAGRFTASIMSAKKEAAYAIGNCSILVAGREGVAAWRANKKGFPIL